MPEIKTPTKERKKRAPRKKSDGAGKSSPSAPVPIAEEKKTADADVALDDDGVAFAMPADGESNDGGKTKRPERYFEAVGRRKTAIARVRLFTKAGDFIVNGKPYGQYFPAIDLLRISEDALKKMKLFARFRISVKVLGGGSHAQAEAVRHGLARCLVKFNADFRKRLKRAGFLKRDPRAKERKKFGLKRARKAPQWAKR